MNYYFIFKALLKPSKMEIFGYPDVVFLASLLRASLLRASYKIIEHYEYLISIRFLLNLFPLIFMLSIQPFKTILFMTDPFFRMFRALTPKIGNYDSSLVIGLTAIRALKLFLEVMSKLL